MYLHFLALFVIPGSPEIASESISYGINFQQKQQNESKMDAGEPKPSRGIDLSPPHVPWLFSDSIGIHPFLKWGILSQTISGKILWNLCGSTYRRHKFSFSIAYIVFCAIVSTTKNIGNQCFADFCNHKSVFRFVGSPTCFDGAEEESIAKFEQKIDGP